MNGIKKICQQIKQQAPWWTTPFDVMTPQTLKKITRPPVGQKKSAMYQAEVDGMLKHLAKDHSPKGRQNMAIVMTLLRTGLRAAELCAVNWSDIDYDTDKRVYRLRGIGKGSKPFEMDLGNDAVLAIKAAYLRKNHIMPRTDTPVFLSLANYKGKTPARLSKVVMHNRLAAIGQVLKDAGIIRGNLEFSAHLFRRTSITLLYGKGFKIADLQKFSRHASVNTLIDHYVDSSESAAPMLDEILAEAAC
jgi:integrase